MELLELPLDAFALRFHTLPATAAASFWAWLAAAVAAALGLWGFLAVGSKSNASSLPDPPPAAPTLPEPPTPAEPSTPKVRFTAYYHCEGCCSTRSVEDDGVKNETYGNARVDDGVDAAVEGDDGEVAAPWTEREARWEITAMAVRRKGDLGWYRYQDMTALNGSVVTLWEESPRRRRRRRARAEQEFYTFP